jgi:hypothetical protein
MGSQANNFEELVPLVDLYRAGKLFEVQAWISVDKRAGEHCSPASLQGRGRQMGFIDALGGS